MNASTEPVTFTPFRHLAGDLYQRVGGSNGLQWRHISRDMAWGHIIDLLSEAEAAERIGDTIHSKRLARDANCLALAVLEHDDYRACMDHPANQNSRSEYA